MDRLVVCALFALLYGFGPAMADDGSLKNWRHFYDKGLNKVNPPLPNPCKPPPRRVRRR